MLRRLVFIPLWLLVTCSLGRASAPTPASYDRVDVAPTRTSIYIGTVAMTMPTLTRKGDTYSAPYSARVFPYFFSSEKGTFSVTVTAAQLAELAKGNPIDFTGQGVRDDGALRPITGRATPTDATHGSLKVRVRVSKHIELIFHTTYRFSP